MTNTLASITYEDDITTITLDDGKVNAFSYEMLTQMHRLLDEVPHKSGALIIKGRNGIFSGGFDLKTLATADLSNITKMIESGYNLLLKLYSFDRPIIAAVSGHAIALGLFVACCSDYRIAIDGKYVCHANEVRNNMAIPDQIMEILKERVNKKYFYSAIYHADPFSVKDAIDVGYIDEVVSEDRFMERVNEKAKELASLPHPFYANTKKTAQKERRKKIRAAIRKHEIQTSILRTMVKLKFCEKLKK